MSIKQTIFGLGLFLAIGASSAQAQIVPGFQIVGQGVNPYTGGVKTVQQTYNPIFGTQTYQSYVNPYTGFSAERQYTLSPFGNYSSVWVNPGYGYYNQYFNPYYGSLSSPYYNPYISTFNYDPQMAAYNYGIMINRMRSNPRYWR